MKPLCICGQAEMFTCCDCCWAPLCEGCVTRRHSHHELALFTYRCPAKTCQRVKALHKRKKVGAR